MKQIKRIPIRFFYPHVPAIPLVVDKWVDTLKKLLDRQKQMQSAKDGLSNLFTLIGKEQSGYSWMYGKNDVQKDLFQKDFQSQIDALVEGNIPDLLDDGVVESSDSNKPKASESDTEVSLEKPEQFAMSWTNEEEVYTNALPLLPIWAATLTDVKTATEQFWPILAKYGLPYNLLILQKVTGSNVEDLRSAFGSQWNESVEFIYQDGNLFAIDLRIFALLKSRKVNGFTRFTPATITLLKQDVDKNLSPISVYVTGYQGRGKQVFTLGVCSDSTWLYALQAAKTSVTVYGIWLGHVGHWHIPTAAMQMTMYNNFDASHPIYQLADPQSDYLMAFDNILLLLWKRTGPPTSVSTTRHFLSLINEFYKDRGFFEDDPLIELEKNGILEKDFSDKTAWDKYPIVYYYVKVWNLVKEYIEVFVNTSYKDDNSVLKDKALQNWIKDAGKDGNIEGLPKMNSKAALARVLTSFLYRITMHGCSRLSPAANPGLTFVANFPPCLQNDKIPSPTDSINTKSLLTYLPKTGTLGLVVNFYFTFVFSAPYEPFIPMGGVDSNLFFPGGKLDARNKALVEFRKGIIETINEIYANASPKVHQWPLNIET